MKKIIAALTALIMISCFATADVNEDKNVDILDLVCLKKILINTDGITLSQGETAVTDNWN